MGMLLAALLAFPTVLMYHRVDVWLPSDYISQALTVSPAQFAAELQYLHDQGSAHGRHRGAQRDLRDIDRSRATC